MSAKGLQAVPQDLSSAVSLWWVNLDVYIADEPLDGLRPEELARADRMVSETDGRRFLASRHAMYRVLGQALNRAPEGVMLSCNEFGKPQLIGGELNFNLSRSGSDALIGVSLDMAIGVDLEVVRRVSEADALARLHFTSDEYGQWRDVGDLLNDRRFLEVWTRKEACVKALGTGLSIPPALVEAGSSEQARSVRVPLHGEFAEVTVCSLQPSAGTIAAVALTPPVRVPCYRPRPGDEAGTSVNR
jgi:4'-phosphopantetheinyl transferase